MGSTGGLVLTVGPSGAGKDSVIQGARIRLRGDERFLFPRRIVTRPAGSVGEDHLSMSEADFAATERAGGFLLSWRAHGLAYGVPASIGDDLADGRVIVINVSRTSIQAAVARFPATWVALITASPAVLAERLSRRGRENAADMEARMARADAVPIAAPHMMVFENVGPLNWTVDRFVTFLDSLAAAVRPGFSE